MVLFKDAGKEAGFIGAMPVVSQPKDLALLTADHKVNAGRASAPGVAGLARAEAETPATASST